MQETRPLEKSNMHSYAVDIRHLKSRHVEQEYRICVARPPERSATKLPVIYGLDGTWVSGLIIDSTVTMIFAEDLPQALVVTIGYPFEAGAAASGLRARDLSPTRRESMEKYLSALAGPNAPPVQTGGAANFVKFINDELKPLIERDYNGDPDDATITGNSFGGLFGAYALLNAPGVFKRYNIVSPSIWWDEQRLVRQEQEIAAAGRELGGKVFICAGGRERKEDFPLDKMPPEMREEYDKLDASDRDPLMVEIVVPFAARLASRGYGNLEVSQHIFEGETHTSVYVPAISRGLRTIFGTYKE